MGIGFICFWDFYYHGLFRLLEIKVMKAKAPEKIYVVDATFPDYVDFDGSPINTKRIDDHDIEYTRTDAFIEKAKKWFKKQNEWFDPNGNYHCDMESFEDFKKYIEGE